VTFTTESKPFSSGTDSSRIDWLALARDVCRDVFETSYGGLLGLPMPQISHLDQTHPAYASGSYHITIGNGWQIHLDLGRLPDNRADFEREIRVLLHHEIEHYRTCPFSLKNHLRMMNTALKICKNPDLAASIVNQVADIIIDTKNFNRNPVDTAWSERLWIRKSSPEPLEDHPDSSRLLFLTKQGLWKTDLLPPSDRDEALQPVIETLVNVFENGGITNPKTLLMKVGFYSMALMRMMHQEGYQPDCLSPPGSAPGSHSLVVAASDEQTIADAIADFASETSLGNFIQVLEQSGLGNSRLDMAQIWYEQNCSHTFELPFRVPAVTEAHMAYPVPWRISDPPDALDLMLSLQTSPLIIPNMTTRKWVKNHAEMDSVNPEKPDMLLVIDSSVSMVWQPEKPDSPYHVALLAAFSLLEYYRKHRGRVAGINFSSQSIHIPWTTDYEAMKILFLQHLGGNTHFPVQLARSLMEGEKKRILVILTDDELSNWDFCQQFFLELLDNRHNVLLFLIRKSGIDITRYESFLSAGGRMSFMQNADDIYHATLEEL
jgi:hypothetical protein